MPFIKAQKVVRDGEGRVSSGSASIVDVEYVRGAKHHSRQVVRERLGKVVELAEDGRSGVFRSPTRGLVRYDADSDAFAAVERGDGAPADESSEFPEPARHVAFGDAHLMLSLLGRAGLLGVAAAAFPGRAERARHLCHLAHSLLRDGSRVACSDMVARSALSHLMPEASVPSLASDTAYFSAMGEDASKEAFFKAFAAHMREAEPGFGRACYVDSTPLPNDISGNPFNALSCHGLSGSSVQCRLVLVLDEASGMPVWYDIVPGNLLDLSTIEHVRGDVRETLGLEVSSSVLDSGYVSRPLVEQSAREGGMSFLARMPARRGYPFKAMYAKVKGQLGRGKYAFSRDGRPYFGRHFAGDLFGAPVHFYVYVDRERAMRGQGAWLEEKGEEWDALKDCEKDWESVRAGFFVLLSDREMGERDALDAYLSRMDVESAFKTSKEYLGLLPLRKWTDLTVRGKILHDIVATVALLTVRSQMAGAGMKTSVSDLWGKASSLMCYRSGGRLVVETPTKKVRERYGALGLEVPASLDVDAFRRDVLLMPV